MLVAVLPIQHLVIIGNRRVRIKTAVELRGVGGILRQQRPRGSLPVPDVRQVGQVLVLARDDVQLAEDAQPELPCPVDPSDALDDAIEPGHETYTGCEGQVEPRLHYLGGDTHDRRTAGLPAGVQGLDQFRKDLFPMALAHGRRKMPHARRDLEHGHAIALQ